MFFILFAATSESSVLWAQAAFRPAIPKTWDDASLADWVTPVAGLNVRPTHISAKDYYSLAVENLRTYPVYFPGREPEGYWQMLQNIGPKPLIEPGKLLSEADWIEAGRRVFEEADDLHLRTFDPKFIAEIRSSDQAPARVLPDGTVFGMRWAPVSAALALPGRRPAGTPYGSRVQLEKDVLVYVPPFFMGPEPVGKQVYRAYGVPWRKDDVNKRFQN